MDEWISVTDRLPPKYEYVICVGKLGAVFIGERMSESDVVRDGKCNVRLRECGKFRYCTHWMPIPELPKGETK